ncbi:hypothetical protein RHGRI_019119 [Rhododendron griersonianum]|uniref:(+)-neomenthol dehydrogenase-like n=1 Tax=Rhododendron griersonianum TaxID=479676 RepID=A0AAV6JBE7_9ERIC|nr:hypothetical protein RHGRI_019119 [Rhododendron griersonianum]
MAETRYAIVTGANKGIGFEICRQLASNGIMVVLTARDEKRGTEAIEKLKGFGLCDLLVFHQLDVANPSSIASFADFIKTQFGRLDILVNNAGILGATVDWDAFKILRDAGSEIKANEAITQTYELTKECLETNFYGAKRMIEAFIPLLQLSNSPRIINVSSERGKLKTLMRKIRCKSLLRKDYHLSPHSYTLIWKCMEKDAKSDCSYTRTEATIPQAHPNLADMAETKRYAIVTGANKGIGFGICRQLASNGIMVVLTARDEKRGTEALEELKGFGLSDLVVFHQLDITNPASIASLADFIKTMFGRLDILVNNAGIGGVMMNSDAVKASGADAGGSGGQTYTKETMIQTYELAKECLETNYYGAKRMIEAFIPLLQLSGSPRIVNVSSGMGKLENIPCEWAKGVLSDAESLTEEKIDEVLNKFLKDFKEGSLETKGWPLFLPAYKVSKAAMNAYTRVVAKDYPTFRINCVCPGFVKTDINNNAGILSVEEGAASPVRLALLPDDGPTGFFFVRKEVSSFE